MATNLKRTSAAIFTALAATSLAAAAGGEFPYVAYVIEPDTYIRSGPGNHHYATGQLPAGYAVEVYRHDAEGWCAIRPPEASYSLVGAHQLKMIDQQTAEVASDGVVARVGSSLGQQRTAVQVMLQRGERLQVLAPASASDPWVMIAPPRGEFRWIAARRLSRQPPVESAPAIGGGWQSRGLGTPAPADGAKSPGDGQKSDWPASGPVTTPLDERGGTFTHLQTSTAAGAAASPVVTAINETPSSKLPWQPSAPPQSGGATATPAGGEPIEIVAGSPADARSAERNAPPPAPTAGAAADSASVSANESPESAPPRIRFHGQGVSGPLDERVAEMETRLSQIVVQPPAMWQLASVREEAAARLAQEEAPEVREQLRDLLDRVATFESVQAKYRLTPGQLPPAIAAAASPAAAPAAVGQLAVAGQAATPGAATPGLTSNSADVLARVRSDLGFDDGITPTPGGPAAGAATVAATQVQPATEALYDAVGTLKPVVSRRDQAPQFALVDDHGDVVTFVTASADVNLQPFVGQRIGVRGSRGFMPEYRRAHVTASRVTPLETRLVK
jgi:hypothetical protein